LRVKRLAVSHHFRKQLKKLPPQDRAKAVRTLKEFLTALATGAVPVGFGLKKINGDKYEIRVDLRMRIVMKAEGDTFVCHLVGDHDDVRRYLRAYRRK